MVRRVSMVLEWISCLDKRPADRTGEDLDIIYSRLKDLKAFEKFHPLLLQQICYYSYYEDLEQGVILFRQGDIGTNWYAVLSGSLDVSVSDTAETKDPMALCTLGIGTAFGESILNNTPRHATVITSEYCELLRVEQKDFKVLWERNKQLMEGVLTPPITTIQPPTGETKQAEPITNKNNKNSPTPKSDLPNPAAPITDEPSDRILRAGHVLRTILLMRSPQMIRDRKYHLRTYRRCMVGNEMVDWLLQQCNIVHSRNQAGGMWQALLEEGVIVHVCHEHQFKDKYLFYRFDDDDQGVGISPNHSDKKECDEDLQDTLSMLAQIAPDAMMRMILRKAPHERSVEDLEIIYDELLHIKALQNLSTMVKRELASILVFESHAKAGTVLFNQGVEGKCWYIILKGSVNVVIYGKGVVCTLHEGDDFGKIALVNDAPRAASIVLREDNCHFLRVDKEDYIRILRDVEANTVRLKEHGEDVLVLEKIPTHTQTESGGVQSHYKYSVMAGTPEKMLEHLLEGRLGKGENNDVNMEDFLLTHVIFMPSNHLCPTLMAHYHANVTSQVPDQESDDFVLCNKRKVIQFVHDWTCTIGEAFWEDKTILAFLEELYSAVEDDSKICTDLNDDLDILQNIMSLKNSDTDAAPKSSSKKRLSLRQSWLSMKPDSLSTEGKRGQGIKPNDQNIFKVYCADHTYTTLKLPYDITVEAIMAQAADKLCLGDELVMCEVKSNGERVIFKEDDICVTSSLSVNGKLFITPREHIDALTPLPEQDGPTNSSYSTLEMLSSKDIAYQLTIHDWQLFTCVHEYELIYHVFSHQCFHRITANLDLFLRRFNEVQYWVVSEMCLTTNLNKRMQLLKKFIKIAAYCKDNQNMNSFFAIVMGLSNIAVSRLSQTWEKLPSKFKKLFSHFELTMDPSRNHRVYRLSVGKMAPPVIPFMPLLMKDMTFTHEGNKTHFDIEGNDTHKLVNFEKMHMIAQTLRTVKLCRSKDLDIEQPPTMKSSQDVKSYVRNLKVIDNQRLLTKLSHKLEARRS